MAKQILITGGAGFIGRHLVRRLVSSDVEVAVLDNFSSSNCDADFESILDIGNVRLVRRDVKDADRELFDDKFDCIYNLACPASPKFYQRDPVQTLMTCVEGTVACLQLAYMNGCRMVQASTSEIYGDPILENHGAYPLREEYRGNTSCTGVRACYDEGKRAAETLCCDYKRKANVDVRIARIFNTYGPGMRIDDGRVLTNFIVQALRGDPLTVYGDGSQTRSLCYVGDTVDALIKLAERDPLLPEHCAVNIGGGYGEITILELANRVIALCGSQSSICYQSLPADDPVRRWPDISLAYAALCWWPRVALNEGLTEMINDIRTRL